MAERSQYNERYFFQDPSYSASRSTRYRARKRSKGDQSTSLDSPYASHPDPVPRGIADAPVTDMLEVEEGSEHFEELITQVSATSTPYSEGIVVNDSCDQPQVLEYEVLGNDDEDEYHDSEEEEEQPGPENEASNITLPMTTNDDLLYDGAPLTVPASGVLIMQYKMRHKLTDESVADLLELLRLHCPTPNCCIPSMYHFKKQFRSLVRPIQFHYFCSNCLQPADEQQSSTVCSNPLCKSDLTEVGARSSFIETDIESQLQVLFERKCTHIQ